MAILRCSQCGSLNRVADERAQDKPVCGRCKVRLDPSGAPQAVTGEALAEAIRRSPVPILVDYWAAWCGPCRTAAPILEQIAQKNAGRLLVLKVNVDDEQGEARQRNVQGIPAFLLFEGGREVARRAGVASAAELTAWIRASTQPPAASAGR